MIYPSDAGLAGELLRLHALERIWIQGRLRMWGRWSFLGGGKPGNIFSQLQTSRGISKRAMKNILGQLKAMGLSTQDITDYFADILENKHKSSLELGIDSEALLIDKVIGQELREHANLITLLHQRYYGSGKSKQKMALELHSQRHDISFMTCRRRIDTWLNVAESILYKPMSYAFDKKMKL